MYDYSPGGLRVKKRFNHWVDTCDVGPDPNPDPDPEMMMMAYMPWPPVDPCVAGYSNDYTYYVRGQSGNVLVEYDDLDDDPVARYVYAGSQRIAMIDSDNNVYYYLNDHVGSAGVLIASDGTVRDTYKYKPFGAGSGGAVQIGQAYRYTGKPLDEVRGRQTPSSAPPMDEVRFATISAINDELRRSHFLTIF